MSNKNTQNVEESFSTRLRRARLDKRLTQEELARMMGVSPGAIGNWETGTTPRAETVAKLAALVGVHPNYLLFGEQSQAMELKDAPLSYEIDDLIAAIEQTYEDLLAVKRFALRMKRKEKSVNELTEEQRIALKAAQTGEFSSSSGAGKVGKLTDEELDDLLTEEVKKDFPSRHPPRPKPH